MQRPWLRGKTSIQYAEDLLYKPGIQLKVEIFNSIYSSETLETFWNILKHLKRFVYI